MRASHDSPRKLQLGTRWSPPPAQERQGLGAGGRGGPVPLGCHESPVRAEAQEQAPLTEGASGVPSP